MSFEFIDNGSPTSVQGFLAAGVTAGFKRSGNPDFAMIFSETPAEFAGVFTSCTFAAAPVCLCRRSSSTAEMPTPVPESREWLPLKKAAKLPPLL